MRDRDHEGYCDSIVCIAVRNVMRGGRPGVFWHTV